MQHGEYHLVFPQNLWTASGSNFYGAELTSCDQFVEAFFELQNKQEEETLEEIVRALEAENFDGDSTNPPIRSSSAVAAREEFLADYYRGIMAQRQPPVPVAATPNTGSNISRPLESPFTTMSPSLLVPRQHDSSDYIYLPQ